MGAAGAEPSSRRPVSARRRRRTPTIEELTPQELLVALTVAEGATNREAAAARFLSTKTIEAHLSRAYRKLGVRSRAELTRVLARHASREAESGVDGPRRETRM